MVTFESMLIELQTQKDQQIELRAKEETVRRIIELAEKKDVVILGHNYMRPEVYRLSGKEARGDSLGLSRYAASVPNRTILFDGVLFMAETAKILCPEKRILIADLKTGCSLADPFKAKDVIEYKKRYPNAPVVTYINSYAEVKAETDYCCTSANAPRVVMHAAKEFNSDRVIFFPDSFMGRNIQDELDKQGIKLDVIFPGKYDNNFGRCEVHEKFSAEHIRDIRKQFNFERGSKETAVLAHWECKPEVLREADFYGSTSGMARYVKEHPELRKVYLATECEMAANLSSEYPGIEFVKTCVSFCQYMQMITLDKILYSLENDVYEVNVPEDVRKRALGSIERMLNIK